MEKVIDFGTGTSMPSQTLQEWYGSFSFPSCVYELPTSNYGTYDFRFSVTGGSSLLAEVSTFRMSSVLVSWGSC